MKQFFLAGLMGLSLTLAAQKKKEVAPTPVVATSPDSMYAGLKWRNIGPFRGGRANAVSGVVKNDQRFYAGYTGGGVWMTDDGGGSWKNISDGFLKWDL